MITGQGGRDKRVPVRLTKEGWPAGLQRSKLGRLFVHDPTVIADPAVGWEPFTRAMFNLHVGGTAKITWPGRQTDADQMLVDHVDLDGARIVEMGASDGSPAVDLIARLGDRFKSYVITDRFVRLTATRHAGWVWLWRDGECILAGNGRLTVWPDQSPALGRLMRRTMAAAEKRTHDEVLMLNPNARAILDQDDRVTWASTTCSNRSPSRST